MVWRVGAVTLRAECCSEARQKGLPPEGEIKACCCQNRDISGDGVEILIGFLKIGASVDLRVLPL